jgi:DNA repair and recombination RAD54-like protein
MGLGKTLMTVGVICALHRQKRDMVRSGSHTDDDRCCWLFILLILLVLFFQIFFLVHLRQRFVVVCPSSLVKNWAHEFDKWIGKASQPKRVIIKGGEEGIKQLKAFSVVKPGCHSEVLIISFDLFRMNVNCLKDIKKVALLVVDEGTTQSVHSSLCLLCKLTVFLLLALLFYKDTASKTLRAP